MRTNVQVNMSSRRTWLLEPALLQSWGTSLPTQQTPRRSLARIMQICKKASTLQNYMCLVFCAVHVTFCHA